MELGETVMKVVFLLLMVKNQYSLIFERELSLLSRAPRREYLESIWKGDGTVSCSRKVFVKP